MRDQVVNPKCLILLFVMVMLTYGVEGISHGEVCEAGDILAPGESCTYPGTNIEFSVLNNGSGQFQFFTSGNSINLRNTVINGVSYTFVANKLASGSWEIEEIGDSTAPTTTNTAPSFTEGARTTRSVAENTATNVNIGNPIAATDADNDSLTYTLGGTDAASFNIESTTGQLKAKSALDYESKSTYTVTITVSDGSLTDSITVTINITDVVETSTQEAAVNLPDPNLRAKIETALGKASGDPISAAEMETLTTLTAQNAGITNLTGLETATNLTELQLWDNQLSNISPVVGLTSLTKLYLWGNTISDISPVAGLTNLKRLYLGENNISSISAVAGLTTLTHLYLNENSLSNISPLAGLTNLTELRIGDNTISDISAVTNLTNLVWLDAPNNSISDISAVANLNDLVSLILTSNTISDISTLTGLTELIEVFLEENAIADLSPFVANTGLGGNTEIYVGGNPLSYPSIYTHIPALQARDVYVDFDSRTPTAPVKISGDSQQGTPSTALAQPFVVEVRDGDSVVFAGVPVTFAVTVGGGTLSVTNTTTDVNGRAQTTLTLGSNTGTNTVTVGVQGISQTATFTATATTANTAPTFTEGASTTRTVAENTTAGVNIGSPVAATDAQNDTLTYSLGGADATSFALESTTGQLKTKASLDYETKRSYTVTITVTDGSLTDSITVTITITDVTETPADTEVCEVGDVLAPGESCTYPGTDAKFSVLSDGRGQFLFFTSGNNLNISNTTVNGVVYTLVARKLTSGSWEIKEITDSAVPPTTNNAPTFTEGASTIRSVAENTAANVNIGNPIAATDADNDTLTYTLSGTDAMSFGIVRTSGQLKTKSALDYETKSTYTVTVTVSDGSLTDTITVTINVTNVAETQSSKGICEVGDMLTSGESCTYPGTDATFSVLDNGSAQWHIPDLPPLLAWINQTSISGSLSISTTINGETYHFVAEELSSGSWEIKEVGDDRIEQPDPPQQPDDTSGVPTLSASTTSPLREASLDESIVTLTLSGGTFENFSSRIRSAVSVSTGIQGVTVRSFDIDRVSDTQVTVELTFDGTDFDINSTITFTVGAGAITDYDGTALTTQVPVTASRESVVATTTSPLTEDTLDGSVVTLTLSGRNYESSGVRIRNAVTVSGISGVTVGTFDIDRVNDTQITVELTFDGNINTDSTLTLTVGAGAIANYNGPALTAQVSVAASTEAPTVTDGQTPEPPQQPGGTPTLHVSTTAPLTEATLHESIVTLTLSDGTYEQSSFRIRNAIIVSGIDDLTKSTFGVDRVSDTEATVELEFNGNISTDSTVNISVGAGAIADYDGAALTAQLTVTAVTESIAVSTDAPLTEANLDESVVTLTLSGRNYEQSSFSVRRGVTVSGIDGVTVGTFDVDRVSDTQVTVELTFDGTNFDTTSSLTFTVEADAIAGYGGPSLTAQVTVTAGTESLTASTAAPLTEATLNGSVVTLTLSGRNYERSTFTIRDAITLSGVPGVTIGTFGVDRISDIEVTVELTFGGNIDTDSTLTLTLAASGIANYDGSEFTAQLPVTAGTESLVASTDAPLTEANLDESVVTLTLSGRVYEQSSSTVRRAVTVSGINGVTVSTFDVDRISDTEVTVELTFDGADFDTDATLTFTVEAGAIAGYDGPAFTAQILVTASTESLVASTTSPLTEATLDESVITLTLSGGIYERSSFRIRDAVILSGISGVSVGTFGIDRVSDIEITVELEFEGNIQTDSTLIFTVGSGAIANYNGPALTAELPVTAGPEADANNDGVVDTQDLVLVASNYGQTGQNAADVNGDGVVNVDDVLVIIGALDDVAAAPLAQAQALEMFTAADVKLWLSHARQLDLTDATTLRDILFLEQLLAMLLPNETVLLPNYPNPFNPETWIPYRLAHNAFVTLTIYDGSNQVIRTLDVGYRVAAFYESRSEAIYWDGRNEFGEQVSSGIYFYTLTAADYSATRKMLILK